MTTVQDSDAPVRQAAFVRDGFVGPFNVLTERERSRIATYAAGIDASAAQWSKGLAAHDRVMFELAMNPTLVERVVELLGDDVVVWGCGLVRRAPGDAHLWHTDIESCAPESGMVSAWIGLDNTSKESSLQMIAGSHRIGEPFQQVAAAVGCSRDDRTAEAALEIARSRDPSAKLVQPDMGDGDAVLFDGRLWHGTLNERQEGTRTAVIVQYARGDRAVHIPKWDQLEWPFEYWERPRPKVIAVHGQADATQNRLVAPPPRSSVGRHRMGTAIRSFQLPLATDGRSGFRSHHLFKGSTPMLRELGAHMSVLEPGRVPHPPHAHLEEEILVVLEGEAEVVLASSPDDVDPRIERFGTGDWAFYRSYQHHTIRSAGPAPVTYLMFRWLGTPRPGDEAPSDKADVTIYRAKPPLQSLRLKRVKGEHIVNLETGALTKLHTHWSHVSFAGGYKRHADNYDLAIVLLAGRLFTRGRVVSAPAVIFHPADDVHGLHGVGIRPAEYVVFEWHSDRPLADTPAAPSGTRRIRRALRYRRDRAIALVDPRTSHVGRVQRRINYLGRRGRHLVRGRARSARRSVQRMVRGS